MRVNLSRQYQYRSQIECEAGHFQTSLDWLGKSIGLREKNLQPIIILEELLEAPMGTKVFGAMHYVRLMAETAIQNDLTFANELYKSWVNIKIEAIIFNPLVSTHLKLYFGN